jgi:integrase
MAWVESRKGWMKQFRGKKYAVSCKQLRESGYALASNTKDGSRAAANSWWDQKETELVKQEVAEGPPPLTPLQETALALLKPRHEWEPIKQAFHERNFDLGASLWPGVHRLYEYLERGRLPKEAAERLPPARVQQIEDANKVIRGEPAEADRTAEVHGERWLKKLQAKVDAGRMTAARCANNRTCLAVFQNYLGTQSDVTQINSQTLEGYYLHCLKQITARRQDPGRKQGWSCAYARDVFSVARSFLRWLWECGTIELPKNIDSRSFDFGSHGQVVRTWTVDEFKEVVSAAPGKLKLAILLMANCGMTQVDVSDLLDSEVSWGDGHITRKRSKTRAEENVPTVSYLLWPTTFALLKKYRSGQDRVLLTESGEPYVRTRLNEKGRLVKADGFASNYAHLQKRLKLRRPLKQLRKLGASLLASHKDYGRLASYFLGHSPRTVADRHYVIPPAELFDEAVTWLGVQLGQVGPCGLVRASG